MPNWASTNYSIEGGKRELGKIYEAVKQCMTQNQNWEGEILKALGATDKQLEKSSLRGFIDYYQNCNDYIRIEAEEAWGTTDFRNVLLELMPDLTIFYSVEEPGCEVYATNDHEGKYYPERFYVDACIEDTYHSEYFEKEEDALAFAAELLGRKKMSKEDLDNWNEDIENDNYIYLHEFEMTE